MKRVSRGRLVLDLACILALVLGAMAGVAALAVFGQPSATAQPASSASSCPLPLSRQINAVKAFREMLPVFRHPRCSNCHGGMDIFSARHPGAEQIDANLNPTTQPMTPAFREAFEPQCQTCHDGLKGWTVPPPPLFFVDKDDKALCRQMKGFGNDTGARFISHIHDDHGGIQFIAAGFLGDRALGEGLKDYGLKVEKPPGTQLQLEARARNWVAWMGGNWVGGPDCGCAMPKVEAAFTQVDSVAMGNALGAGNDSERVTGTVVFAPVDGDPPVAPSFADVKSSFFQVESGTITIDIEKVFHGLAGSRCTTQGRKSFPVASLPQRLRRHLWIEIAEDGRYRLSLGLQDQVWQTWQMDVESVCTFPTGHVVRERLSVNEVAVVLGIQQGQLTPDAETVGRLPAPIRQGPRTIEGHWSIAANPPR